MFTEYQHTSGQHCGSASLQNLADYYNWELDEASCFGLGAGIGFGYGESETASRMIIGRSPFLETAFFNNLGTTTVQKNSQSKETAWNAFENQLKSGPVLCFVDLFYLPYFGSSTHFGPHTIVVIDIDDNSVTISDSEFDEPQTVSRAAFDNAWSSDHGFWPLERRWLSIKNSTPSVATETATLAAIEQATKTMLDGDKESGSGGVAAIRTFADDLPTWTTFDDMQWTARFAYQNIERRGTGGGAFRRLYATFLDTLGSDAGLAADFGERMDRIADDWTVLADILKESSKTDDAAERVAHLTEASDLAYTLANREEALFSDLAEAV